MPKNTRKGKSLLNQNPLDQYLRKRANAPKRKTNVDPDQNLRQQVQLSQMSQGILSGVFNKAVQIAIEHQTVLNIFNGFVDGQFQNLYNLMNTDQPLQNARNFHQEDEPSSSQINFRIESNKFDRNPQFTYEVTRSSFASVKKINYQVYKKAFHKERESRTNSSLHVVTEKYRAFFEEPQSENISSIRNSMLIFETLKDKRNKKLKKHPSKSFDSFPRISKTKINSQYKDFAFDSNGLPIPLRKKENNKSQKQDILETSANSSELCLVTNFADHCHESKKIDSLSRSNFYLKTEGSQIDSNGFKQNLSRSIHIKAGVVIKTKSGKMNERLTNELKLPRI